MSASQPASRTRVPIITIIAAIMGFSFSGVSTHDFVQHLDRDVHGLQCSFLPGLGAADLSGESGCYATMMSPYSSILRESIWGGIPISLPAMAVFAFLAAWGVALLVLRRGGDRAAMGFTALAWALPVLASAIMAYISLSALDTACKLCIGIYTSSALGMAGAIWAWRRAAHMDHARGSEAWGWAPLAMAFVGGVIFVLIPVVAYAASAPAFSEQVESCGTLIDATDPHEVLLPIGPQTHEIPVIEVLDPLCPLCRGFERRFAASSAPSQVSRRVLLFPLDTECNWMLDQPLHPGACSISEAVLCAQGEAKAVIEWAFENQEAIIEMSKKDPAAAANMARERFPSLAECIGSPKIKATLNGSLRWAVKNQLPILTPQMYVGERKLCDADTDLGLEYSLEKLFALHRQAPSPEGDAKTEREEGERGAEEAQAKVAASTETHAERKARRAASSEPSSIDLGPAQGASSDRGEAMDAGSPANDSDADTSPTPDAGSSADPTLDDLAEAAKGAQAADEPVNGKQAAEGRKDGGDNGTSDGAEDEEGEP